MKPEAPEKSDQDFECESEANGGKRCSRVCRDCLNSLPRYRALAEVSK